MTKRIALGADHAGFEEKEKIKATLDELGVEYVDMGTDSADSVDYPDYAKKVAEAVSKGEFEQGCWSADRALGWRSRRTKLKEFAPRWRGALILPARAPAQQREHPFASRPIHVRE
jgi:ribose 5-phosphate isomerase B